MTFFGFTRVKWLQYTGKVGKCTSYQCQIFSGFNTPKIIKNRLIFDRVIAEARLEHSTYKSQVRRPTNSILPCHHVIWWRNINYADTGNMRVMDIEASAFSSDNYNYNRPSFVGCCQK